MVTNLRNNFETPSTRRQKSAVAAPRHEEPPPEYIIMTKTCYVYMWKASIVPSESNSISSYITWSTIAV